MSVHVLHHGRCFDGAASAALFAAFARSRLNLSSPLRFIPKHHCQGEPFVPEDFSCDWAACVDFRYSASPKLTWYFDHHRSAFSSAEDRAHFDADQSGQKFHDPRASSCAQMLATLAHRHFGFDPGPYAELIHWADLIDAARFPDPQSAIDLETPAMRLAAYIQGESHPAKIEQFIEDLLRLPLPALAGADYLQPILQARLDQQQDNLHEVANTAKVQGPTVIYDLMSRPPRVINHFIPYVLHPEISYALGAYVHSDQTLRITVGYNPWHPGEARKHDLATLCESFGGGGHPYVAGCSFAPHETQAASQAFEHLRTLLCESTESSAPNA